MPTIVPTPEPDAVSILAGALGLFILLFSLISQPLKDRFHISESLVATAFGVVLSSVALQWVPSSLLPTSSILPHAIPPLMPQLARITIALQVMACGIHLPKAYLRTNISSILFLLGPVMLFAWIVTAALILPLFPDLSFLEALIISACIAPTDPVLAASILSGRFADKYVPRHLRNLLSAESGANDGLGYPFLLLPILLLPLHTPTSVNSPGEGILHWCVRVLLFQIILAVIIGGFMGWLGKVLLRKAQDRGLIDRPSLLAFSIPLALFILGVVGAIGSDDILAVFIAGNAFTWDDWFRLETEDEHLQTVIDMLLNMTFFIYFGATLPWKDMAALGYGRLVALSALVLLLRRLPLILALKRPIPSILTYGEAICAGWFGPIGVGALFYASVGSEELERVGYGYMEDKGSIPGIGGPLGHLFWPMVCWMVLSSVVAHGVSLPLFKVLRTRTFRDAMSRTMTMVSVGTGGGGFGMGTGGGEDGQSKMTEGDREGKAEVDHHSLPFHDPHHPLPPSPTGMTPHGPASPTTIGFMPFERPSRSSMVLSQNASSFSSSSSSSSSSVSISSHVSVHNSSHPTSKGTSSTLSSSSGRSGSIHVLRSTEEASVLP